MRSSSTILGNQWLAYHSIFWHITWLLFLATLCTTSLCSMFRRSDKSTRRCTISMFLYSSFICLMPGGCKRLILLCSCHARYVLYDFPVFYLRAERAASEQSGHLYSLFHFPSYSALYPWDSLPRGFLADSADHSDRFFQHQVGHQLHQVHSSVDAELPAEIDISFLCARWGRLTTTVGWTIYNVLLDFSGGLLSIIQFFMNCIVLSNREVNSVMCRRVVRINE